MKKYEIVLLFNSELGTEALDAAMNDVIVAIKKIGGEFLEKAESKLIAMGYKIRKHKNAHYVLAYFKMAGDKIGELDKILKLQDPILRYTIVKQEESVEV